MKSPPDQLTLRGDDPAARFAATAPAGTLRVADKTVSGEGFSVAFDPKSGFIRSYRLRNVELLAGPVRPNFYRAATDNDLGVRQTREIPRQPDVGQGRTAAHRASPLRPATAK